MNGDSLKRGRETGGRAGPTGNRARRRQMSRDLSSLDDREELERRLQELQGQLEDFRRRHGELRLALETLTTIDPVSGVRNRLGILQSMEGSLQWNKREGLPFGVAVMHIPGLAELRRQEDHDLFEESLAHVAAVISAGLRDVDRVGRWSEIGRAHV